jgi:hypothetical protein
MKPNCKSLRAQEACARYGKAAGHPLCLAWLDVKQRQTELAKAVEQRNGQAEGEPTRFREIAEWLCFQNYESAIARFERQCDDVISNGDDAATRKLRRIKKRYEAPIMERI